MADTGLTVWAAGFWADDVWAAGLWSSATGSPTPTPTPTPEPVPAGRFFRSGPARRRRMYVEIDGQEFEVESAEHAQALLDQAKALARQAAPQKAEEKLAAHLAANPRIRPRIERPHIISPSPELHRVVAEARQVISNIYKAAYRDAEIKLRLAAKIGEDDADDEDLLMLL